MSNAEFRWDKAFVEKKVTLYTNLQMGLVGAALMLMMMDLSKIYFLAPLVAALILVSWYKNHLNGLNTDYKNYRVEIAPKSLLVTNPAQESERRITFREIDEITQHQENLVPIVTIYLKDDAGKVILPALEGDKAFVQHLSALLQGATDAEEKRS